MLVIYKHDNVPQAAAPTQAQRILLPCRPLPFDFFLASRTLRFLGSAFVFLRSATRLMGRVFFVLVACFVAFTLGLPDNKWKNRNAVELENLILCVRNSLINSHSLVTSPQRA